MFLGCGLFALVAIPVWDWVYATQPPLWMPVPAMLWHGHAMIFGFAGAAIAGFLLTAVPSWTVSRGFAGRPLMLLTAVWLAARVLLPLGPGPAWWIASSVELAFLPLLAVLIAPPILRERNRNMVMLALLGALWCADALFLHAVGALEIELAGRALHAALDVILLLITIIGGRIVPAFTSNALRRGGAAVSLRTTPWIERSLVPLMAFNVLVSAVAPTATATGALAGAAAVLHALRLAGWRSLRIRGEPILWVLHLAYAWLPLGFALKAIATLTGADFAQFWLHAFGIGAAATMIMAVMTRASLGHTGRPLAVARSIAWAYGLLTAAVLARVLLPHLGLLSYTGAVAIATVFWSSAFAIFVGVYTPILTRPRVDGKPG